MGAKRILIIEDDLTFSKTLKNILSTSGYDTLIANSGAEGILKVYEFSPDLILCDINMSPIDGFQVHSILNDSSVTNRIPFIFITGRSEIQDIRLGMELGVDDYIVKPFKNQDLLKSIEVRLEKFEKLLNIGNNNYKALVELSPNGIFIFDGETIFEVNQAFSQMTGLSIEDVRKKSFKEVVDSSTYDIIQSKIVRCSTGVIKSFDEQIKLVNNGRAICDCRLYVTACQKYKGFSLLIGILAPNDANKQFEHTDYQKLVHILSEEQIPVTRNLAKKLQHEFDFPAVKSDNSDNLISNSIFSKREKEVLTLSCKGLPIKIIADELCISDRTVEKHRANLMEKTGSKNIVEVIIYALKNELIEL